MMGEMHPTAELTLNCMKLGNATQALDQNEVDYVENDPRQYH
jgi:hypothetical protein